MIRILYCDDERNFRSTFEEKHGKDFEIKVTNDIYGVPAMLNEMSVLPDLVLLDLYHTKASPGSPEANEANKEVEDGISAVKKALDSLRILVNRNKDPAAIKVLEQIRSYDKLKELPVLLYTREGLSLLNDDELHKSIQLGADWMIKGRSKEFERGKIYSFLQKHRAPQRSISDERDVKKLKVGEILKLLTLADIWKIIVALAIAFGAAASFAYWLGQRVPLIK